MSYQDLKKAAGAEIQAKGLTWEGLRIARLAAADLTTRCERWEAMPFRDLLAEREEILALCGILEMYFVFYAKPSEDDVAILQEWEALYSSIPDDGIARLDRLGGRIARYILAERELAAMNAGAAEGRWERLHPVKQWAFDQRAQHPHPKSRASLIREIEPEVVKRAKDAGEPLTGALESRLATITRWFREAGIK